MPLLNYEQV